MVYFNKKWVDYMSENKKINGKNAIVIFNDDLITVNYKNAFGELSHQESKIKKFTYDDVVDIEFKKPGITMNGYLLFVLKNDDIHKIVLNKLDEYSLELTDDLVKVIEEKLGKNKESDEPSLDEPLMVFGNIKKKDNDEVVSPIYVTKPKSKEELVKEEIRKELNERIKENRERQRRLVEEGKLKEEQITIGVGTIKDGSRIDVNVNTVKPADKKYIEEEKPVTVTPLSQSEANMLEKNKHDVIIDELKRKLAEIESELVTLKYKYMIINNYIDETNTLNDIEDLIRKIDELMGQLELIKREILNKIDGKDYIPNMKLDVTGDNKVDVDDFKTIYLKTMDDITEFEKALDASKDHAEVKKEEINISDKEYEENLKKVMIQEGLKDKYDGIIKDTKAYIDSYDFKVGTTFNEIERTRTMNIRRIRNDTRMLLGLSAASMLIPNRGPIKGAILTATGLSVLKDIFIPERRQIRDRYFEQVSFETEINNSRYDINNAYKGIEDSKKNIKDIKKELEERAKNYPEYDELITEFDKIEYELDRQEKEIDEINKTLDKEEEKNNIKILKLERENSQY